ncbi:DUF1634 domain-containing protein [Apilactobacillus kunkeei]|uniref:DUF1634 domain-containing protein n=1 Tax=Apilactobacillus kunkeei TaxID=148814 RepID=UPI0006B248B5|nr:DUF1634 domain-containing protein [Apilactobacillus kunkeei]KOY69244.1 Uncharacterized protein RZ73_10380 [Apilactobacillus kunkeei]MCK8633807.1 DUF1634 domain-containing protein [Apilactobacillus kunkeei]TMT02931.1 DUF1634 domain-containing protein [Apilactobacillus kunkeei]CAI2628109.1 hypothetical protein AKUG0804_10980 [Apilactobacillus kunkeei]CAI2628174.1 hypothetical protein AKUH3B207X_10940 [Apilactobacillus kunkeei]
MNTKQPATTEEMNRIELVIGKILRVGVVISATIMIIGLLLLLITGKSGYAHDAFPTTFKAIFSGIATLKPYAIMMLGIFCLILTPVLRVIVSIYSFYKEKDMLYVWITTFVLIVLIISFFFG